MFRSFKSRLAVVVIVIAIVLPVAAYGLWTSVKAITNREDTSRALGITCEVVAQHFEDTGRWPRSWDELRDTRPLEFGTNIWPAEIDSIKTRVRIDFDVSTDYLAEVDPKAFDAIGPIGEAFPHRDSDVRRLLEKCRDKIKRDRAAARSPVPPSP